MLSDNDRNLDESKEVDDEGSCDTVDVEPARVSLFPPFTVPPPPPLAPQPVPPEPAPDSGILTETAAPTFPPRSSEERPGNLEEEGPGLPPQLPPGRPPAVIPPPPTAPRPIPSRPKAEKQESREVASRASQEYEEEPSTASFDLPRYADNTSHPQVMASKQDPLEKEILADEDGGKNFPYSGMQN